MLLGVLDFHFALLSPNSSSLSATSGGGKTKFLCSNVTCKFYLPALAKEQPRENSNKRTVIFSPTHSHSPFVSAHTKLQAHLPFHSGLDYLPVWWERVLTSSCQMLVLAHRIWEEGNKFCNITLPSPARLSRGAFSLIRLQQYLF